MDSDEERNWVYCGMIKLLGSFLKEKRGDICLYIGFIGVFYVIFSLSNLPVDAVNYAFFLSAIWLLGYGIFKLYMYRDASAAETYEIYFRGDGKSSGDKVIYRVRVSGNYSKYV